MKKLKCLKDLPKPLRVVWLTHLSVVWGWIGDGEPHTSRPRLTLASTLLPYMYILNCGSKSSQAVLYVGILPGGQLYHSNILLLSSLRAAHIVQFAKVFSHSFSPLSFAWPSEADPVDIHIPMQMRKPSFRVSMT